MNKTKKIWLGILSFSPLTVTGICLFIVMLFYTKIISGAMDGSLAYSDGKEFIFFTILIIILAFLLNIIIYVMLIIYTICIVKNKKIDDTAKILYLIGIYFLNTIIPIVYFFIEIAGKKEEIKEN